MVTIHRALDIAYMYCNWSIFNPKMVINGLKSNFDLQGSYVAMLKEYPFNWTVLILYD